MSFRELQMDMLAPIPRIEDLQKIVAEQTALAPDYLAPCPYSTILDFPGASDWIRRPSMHCGSTSGCLMFSWCCSSCPICEAFFRAEFPAATAHLPYSAEAASALASRWTANLRRIATCGPEKIRATLAKIEARGMMPPLSAGQESEAPPTAPVNKETTSASDAPVDTAALCIVGNSVFPRHADGPDGICRRCGSRQPPISK